MRGDGDDGASPDLLDMGNVSPVAEFPSLRDSFGVENVPVQFFDVWSVLDPVYEVLVHELGIRE